MNLKQRSAYYAGLMIGAAALSTWPLVASAQQAATSSTPTKEEEEKVVHLSPFVVTTTKDKGYLATNSISGTRLNSAIKDLPMPIEVITEKFLRDTGSTDLRQSLRYSSGILLQSQNDQATTPIRAPAA